MPTAVQLAAPQQPQSSYAYHFHVLIVTRPRTVNFLLAAFQIIMMTGSGRKTIGVTIARIVIIHSPPSWTFTNRVPLYIDEGTFLLTCSIPND